MALSKRAIQARLIGFYECGCRKVISHDDPAYEIESQITATCPTHRSSV